MMIAQALAASFACLSSGSLTLARAADGDRGATNCASGAPPAAAISTDPSVVLREFCHMRRRQMELDAKVRGVKIPPEYCDVFDKIDKTDWAATGKAFAAAARATGGIPNAKNDARVDRSLWEYVREAYGLSEQIRAWAPDLLRIYADNILDAMPNGAVYFGGTDAGRFIVTAFQSIRQKPLYVLTQNALADSNYAYYLRHQYGHDRGPPWREGVGAGLPTESLEMPDDREIAGVFSKYFRDKGRPVQPGERPVVQGFDQTFAVGSMVAKSIFTKNKKAKPFFLEESYPMQWCYPYAEPAGPILSLRSDPLSQLDQDVVLRDREFWDDLTAKLLGNAGFRSCPAARSAFGKLRASFGHVYGFRQMWTEAEYAFRQGLKLAPNHPELIFGLAELLVEAARFDDALELARNFAEEASDETKARILFDWIEASRKWWNAKWRE